MEKTIDIEEFDFSTKNGRPPGNKGGRPRTEFLKAKKALETIEALKETFGGTETLEFLERLEGKFGKRGKSNTERNLQDLAMFPLSFLGEGFFSEIGKHTAIPGLIAAQWLAEEYVKLPMTRETKKVVDDLEKPLYENKQIQTEVVGGVPIYETRKVLVGYEKKEIITKETQFVPYPGILHMIVDLLQKMIEFFKGSSNWVNYQESGTAQSLAGQQQADALKKVEEKQARGEPFTFQDWFSAYYMQGNILGAQGGW